MRISDWISDVCSSDLTGPQHEAKTDRQQQADREHFHQTEPRWRVLAGRPEQVDAGARHDHHCREAREDDQADQRPACRLNVARCQQGIDHRELRDKSRKPRQAREEERQKKTYTHTAYSTAQADTALLTSTTLTRHHNFITKHPP